MGRIRTIKPEFWTAEQVVELSPIARLLFVGLWNFCDDGGRHPASPKTLKMEVFPGDDFTTEQVSGWISEAINQRLVLDYEVDGRRYWQVTGWHHQRIDKPSYRYPKPKFAEQSSNGSGMVVEQSATEWNGMESNVMEGNVMDLKKEKKEAFDFQSENSETSTEKAPPVAAAPPSDADGDLDPEQVVRQWCRADNFEWLTSAKDSSGYDPEKVGISVNDKLSLFCGHHAENEAFQSDPVAFFKRHFKGYLVNAKTRTATNKPATKPTRSTSPNPAPSSAATAYTVEVVVAMFRARFGQSMSDQLTQAQQRRLAEAKNETELSTWMDGMYATLKGKGQSQRTGPVAIGEHLARKTA